MTIGHIMFSSLTIIGIFLVVPRGESAVWERRFAPKICAVCDSIAVRRWPSSRLSLSLAAGQCTIVSCEHLPESDEAT